MKDKIIKVDIWEFLGFNNEDYTEIIETAGYDADKIYDEVGEMIRKAIYEENMKEKKNFFNEFGKWLKTKSLSNLYPEKLSDELLVAFNKHNENDKIDEDLIKKDAKIAQYYEEFLKLKDDNK